MSYAVPFNLLSFHVSDCADSVATRLTWPLAGSLVIHVAVSIALVSLRFSPSFEQSSSSYQVELVTLPEISASPTASPENDPPPQRNADSAPQAKPRVRELVTDSLVGALEAVAVPKPRALPVPQKATPVPVPAPLPLLPVGAVPKPTSEPAAVAPAESEEAPNPERVTDSLVGALEAVAVPKPRALPVPQKATPVPVPAPLPLLPVGAVPKPTSEPAAVAPAESEEAPNPERVTDSLVGALEAVAVPKPRALPVPQKATPVPVPLPPSSVGEVEAPIIQALPQPPRLASSPAHEKPTPLVSAPSVHPLTSTLKQAVGTIVVPEEQKKSMQARRIAVSPVTKTDRDRKQDTIESFRSAEITLPSQAPPLADVPLLDKKETPVQTARNSPTAESVKQTIETMIRIPESKRLQPVEPVSKAVPLLLEVSPQRSRAAEAQNLPNVVAPPAPPLASLKKEPVPSQPMPALAPPEPEQDALGDKIAAIQIPKKQPFESGQPVSPQTKRGTQEMSTDLQVAESSSKENVYWRKVRRKIDGLWVAPRIDFQPQKPLHVILAIKVDQPTRRVTGVTVVRTSGNQYYDEAAKRAVLKASPLPHFPPTMTDPYYEFKFRFTVGPKQR